MKKVGILAASLALVASASTLARAQSSEPRVFTPRSEDRASTNDKDVPEVQVWLESGTFGIGDVILPHVTADPDAYITVFRVTTDGELRVLYPEHPNQQFRYQPSRFVNDRIPMTGDPAFYIREGTGNGFVFAVASYYRFNYKYYSTGSQWSISRLASASRFGSPFQIVRSFVDEITEGSSSYSMDYVMYDVNADQYHSRYASRYRGYAYNDYYGMCLDAFGGYYSDYCRGYNNRYYGPYVVVSNPVNVPQNQRKSMRIRPLVPDPVAGPPHEPVPVEGVLAPSNAQERAAIERHERMLRDQKPRIDPMQVERRADPDPRVYRTQDPVMRSAPRVNPYSVDQPRMQSPRMDAPRAEPRQMEAPRQMPSAPARVEVRNDPPRVIAPPPAPAPQKQKDN